MNKLRDNANVDNSSLVVLKAELLRKQQELIKARSQGLKLGAKPPSTSNAKKDLFKTTNKGVKARSDKDKVQELSKEESDKLKLSRNVLEAKARLYNKLIKSGPDGDTDKLYMVDFRQKAVDHDNDLTSYVDNDTVGEAETNQKYEATSPEDEWVEYTDALGRSRRCMRKDLERNKKIDDELMGPTPKPSSNEEGVDLQSDHMRRELQRQQWEKEALEELEKPVGPIHYRDVLGDEVRDHGVGYFAFSTETDERRSQMETLKQLRQQTESYRKKRFTEDQKRSSLLKERLAKIKKRKRAKLGLPEEESSEESDGSVEEESAAEELTTADQEAKQTEVVRKIEEPKVRPWDEGKVLDYDVWLSNAKPVREPMSQDEWLAKKREERSSEFAPPQSYSKHLKQKSGREAGPSGERKRNYEPVRDIPVPAGDETNEPSREKQIESQVERMLRGFRS